MCEYVFMKKANILLSVIAIVAFVIATIMLLLVYKLDICSLGFDFFLSVFTGCAFAFPSGGIWLVYEYRSTRRKSHNLVSDIYVLLTSLRTMLETMSYSFDDIELIRCQLIKSYDQLRNTILDAVVLKKDDISNLLTKVFDISRELNELNRSFLNNKDSEEIRNGIKKITDLIEKSIKLIGELQK